jgi:hypothetical protein
MGAEPAPLGDGTQRQPGRRLDAYRGDPTADAPAREVDSDLTPDLQILPFLIRDQIVEFPVDAGYVGEDARHQRSRRR